MNTKICSVCGIEKSLFDFNTRPDRLSGYRSECKKCQYKRPKKPKPKHIVNVEQKFHYALKKGKIQKPLFCELCGEGKKIQAHHPNYKQHLKIIWVCPKCHKNIKQITSSEQWGQG